MKKSYSIKNRTKERFKELDTIYGIEQNKGKIVNYIKYLEISRKDKFANYNIMIHNESSYWSETKNKLINYIYKMLKENNIIKTEYKFINAKELRRFEMNDEKEDWKNMKIFQGDLIIIDSEKIGRRLENFRDEIVSIFEKFPNKVFIMIDHSFPIGSTNALFNQYFDWYFEIDRISEDNKKDFIDNMLNQNDIKLRDNCNYITDLVNEPFFIVKSEMTNVLLECKIHKIKEITDDVAKKYFESEKYKNTKEAEKMEYSNPNKEATLESMIGIDHIKQDINKIVNYVKICQKRKGNLPMLHMCFTGNPGTGKTTVARMIGKIFKDEKILSEGQFVEIHGRDLVGKHVGWTAKEVQEQVSRAKGGILFIDEAYSLNSDRRGSFEDEAISTLIKEMEDNRNDLCVILAGYQKEMKELISLNPGFESRIQFYINFQNYNKEELYEIFKNLAKKEGYQLSSQIKDILQKEFQANNTSKNFSNGRYVRNLYEKIKIEQANRLTLTREENINLIKKCDVEKVLEKVNSSEKTKIKIGFAG